MIEFVVLVEVWCGGIVECIYMGYVVICDENGDIVQVWGNLD